MDFWDTILTIAGLGVITLVTRSFFLLPERELPLPEWLQRGLRYAPLAALAAVLLPETVMRDGHLVATLADARLPAVAAATAAYFWRRSVLDTIAVGMMVFLPLRLGLGW